MSVAVKIICGKQKRNGLTDDGGPCGTGHAHGGEAQQTKDQNGVKDDVGDGAGDAHGAHGQTAAKTPHHHQVGGVEQQLQDAGEHQRQSEKQDLTP